MAQSVTSPVACSFDHVFWGKSYTLMEGQKEKTFDPTPGPGEGHISLTPWPHPPCPKRGLHTKSAIPTSPLSFSGVLAAAHVRENRLNSRPGQRDRGPDASQATAQGKFAPTSNTYLSYWRFSKPNSVPGVLWNFLSGIILQFFTTQFLKTQENKSLILTIYSLSICYLVLPRKLTAVLQPGHGLRTQGPGCKSQPLNLVAPELGGVLGLVPHFPHN